MMGALAAVTGLHWLCVFVFVFMALATPAVRRIAPLPGEEDHHD